MNFANTAIQPASDFQVGEIVFTNARIICPTEIIEGSLVVRDGYIEDISTGSVDRGTVHDMQGDFLVPGLVELHTDNLERHVAPRPGVVWPTVSAVLAHDAEVASAGITTVLDALRIGDLNSVKEAPTLALDIASTVDRLSREDKLKARHLLHLRCELSYDGVVEQLTEHSANESLKLISLMDHTPGQRQFADLEKYREYYGGKLGLSENEMIEFMRVALEAQARNSEPNRREVVDLANRWRVPLASHDDATQDHVAESSADGVSLAEFPTTLVAAQECQRLGIQVMAGAPNVMRGKSHSGNISAIALAEAGCLDILSSDYIPYSLLQAPFALHRKIDGFGLANAVALVTANPARAIGLEDRGRLELGAVADLVRVHADDDVVKARSVFRSGLQVA